MLKSRRVSELNTTHMANIKHWILPTVKVYYFFLFLKSSLLHKETQTNHICVQLRLSAGLNCVPNEGRKLNLYTAESRHAQQIGGAANYRKRK